MADISMVTDDEYLSPDEFNLEEQERDLQKKIAELSKRNECLKKEKDEAHKYINDMSARIYNYDELKTEIKRLTAENTDLNSRLQTGDMEYVKLWKEVFPSKNNPQTETTDKSVSDPVLLNGKTAEQITDTAIASELKDKPRTNEDRIQELETAVKTLMAKLSEESQSKEKLKRRLEQVRDEKQALNEEIGRKISEWENKKYKTEETLRLMTATKEQMEKELEKEKADRALMVKKLSDLQQESKFTEKENTIPIDIESLNQQVDALRGELGNTLRKEMEKRGLKPKKLADVNQDDEKRLAENGKVISSEKESLQEKVDTLQSNLVTKTKEHRAMALKIEELERQLLEQERIKAARDDGRHSSELKKEEPEKLPEEKESIKDNLNEIQINVDSLTEKPTKKKKIVELKLRSARCGMGKTMIDIVTRGLQKLLKDRLVREKIDLHVKPCETLDDDTDGPLFVICLARSILGTKVNALQGVQGNKDTVLILIHYNETNESLLFTPIGFRTYGGELWRLGGTIDMAFNGDSGLYECDTNNAAVEKMTTFLKKF